MKVLNTILVLCFAMLVSACSSIKVQTDYNSEADFVDLSTFSWLPTYVRAEMNRINVGRIKNAVNIQLGEKGFRMASSNPDFLVAMHIGVDQNIRVTQEVYNRGPYRRGYWGGGRTYVDQYEEGSIIIDVVSAKTKELIWQGKATSTLKRNTTREKQAKKINKAIAKLLKDFPPLP
jgi:hypothetical protein